MSQDQTAALFEQHCEMRASAQALAALMQTAPREIVVPFCVSALDHLGAGMPEADSWARDLREDAAFWAETANPAERREYLSAALRVMAETDEAASMALAPRKRMFVALWDSLPEPEKRRFLARVDPKGVFLGAA